MIKEDVQGKNSKPDKKEGVSGKNRKRDIIGRCVRQKQKTG